nr:unnamed protein product [Callosobruchus analis]
MQLVSYSQPMYLPSDL